MCSGNEEATDLSTDQLKWHVEHSHTALRLIMLGTLLLIVAACQAPASVEIANALLVTPTREQALAVVDPAPAVTYHPTNTAPPPPPIVNITNPTATAPAAFVLPNQADLATSTPLPTETPTLAPTATATPQPTFTPPALPGTSENEHYWLRRPISEGYAFWTDKTYPYGSTRSGTLRPHHGVEFNVTSRTPVLSAGAGTVVVAGNDEATAFGPQPDFYGNLVIIEHETRYRDQPVYTLYGHLSEIGVVPGQRVESQQVIALSGASGVADGPHLHFEVRIGRNDYAATRNPLLWLYPFGEHGTIAGTITRPNGTPIEGLLVTATRIDAASTYKASTTYTGNSVNSDEGWSENFVIDDLKAGYYLVQTKIGELKFKQEVWVYPLQTSFVEFQINVPSE